MMQVGEAHFVSMRPEHLEAVVAVEASAHSHPWGHAHFIEALQAGKQAQLLMADGHLLGYFVAMPGVGEVHLLNITVAPEYQRQGWSRVMLDALALWARGRGAVQIWLEVRWSNDRAQHVYAAQGFTRVGVRKAYYPTQAGAREDAVVMMLNLSPEQDHGA